ncbi:hypothetical protein Thimo_0474 [Thioflavicoccus mobilis 8321]|uniref:Uncharacterized protein n=1 Tax=Thioflavicoccus mobilis 8321 TaxID=765912 RepID=L0GU36_9GAMM|nr:hypothetical protein [Thioflavicoccus mobilis]AGA89332.1 hypothetical protein Thimo_0474 [Thioflavicoccus mobilis 8321]
MPVDLMVPIGLAVDVLKRLLPTAVTATTVDITGHLRECICVFQREYASYSFGCARRHREFKTAAKDGDSSKMSSAYKVLDDIGWNGLLTLLGTLSEGVQHYFKLTHQAPQLPRVSVYLADDKGFVNNVVMISGNQKKGELKVAEDYTVFKYVIDHGVPYLNNNLPISAIKDDALKHPGLKREEIRSKYKPRWTDKKLLSRWRNNLLRREDRDEDWEKHWSGDGCHEAKYKSHVAVPITFRKHAASRPGMLAELTQVIDLPDDGRSILGFVLVDHISTYYFDDSPADSFRNVDINILYQFADLMSLALLTYLTYTQGSETVNKFLLESGHPAGQWQMEGEI